MSRGSTRREILAAFLGLPAALAGCSSRPAPEIAGGIVGASNELGHRLRDEGGAVPSPARRERHGVVIVGAGISGLAAAWRLRGAGFDDFCLLELEATPGGNSKSGSSARVAYPWGAHYVPAPLPENRLLVRLLEEMGIVEGRDAQGGAIIAEEHLCRDPQERIYYKGKWYEGLYLYAGAGAEDLAQLRAFNAEVDRWAGWRDARGRRAFTIPVASSSDDALVTALDKLSMRDWLERRGLTSPRLHWLVEYACRDDYGTLLEDTSSWAGLFYFTSRLARPGAQAQPLITWPEGNGRLVAHLCRRVKDNMRLGLAAAEIVPTQSEGRDAVLLTALDNASGGWLGFHADQVIFAAPHFLSAHLIRPFRDNPPHHVREFEYGSWMVANLHMKDRPGGHGFPLAWDNVMYESPSLGYVVATHQLGLDRGPTVFTYYYPLCDTNPRQARARLLDMDWQSCADLVLADLARPHPELGGMVERLDVMRWGHAMIQPRPGFIWGGARTSAARPYRSIYFANSDLSGVSLFEEAFYHGVRAAEQVLAARGQQVASWI